MKKWPKITLDKALISNRSGYWGDETPSANRRHKVKVIRNADLTKSGELKSHAVRFFSEAEAEKSELQVNDIAMSMSGDVGKMWEVHEPDYHTTNFVRILRPNSELLAPGFLSLVLKSEPVQNALKENTTGTTIQNLQKIFYSSAEFPLPSLDEQRHIVTILNEAFLNIDGAKQGVEKSSEDVSALFDAYSHSIFTGLHKESKWLTLKEVAQEFGRGKSKHRPRGDKKLLGGKYPFIQTGDIANAKQYITEYSQTYNEAGLSQSKLWSRGTICIAIVGANVAESAILGFDACFPDSVIGLVVDKNKADAEYTQFLLEHFKVELKEKGKGTARDNINLGTFENLKLPFPSLKRPKEIVARLNKLQKEIKSILIVYENKLTALDQLERSLLHQAFEEGLATSRTESSQKNIPSPYIRNQVHAAIIEQVVRDGGWTTEVVVAKYDHLLQELCGLTLGYQFQTHQFGPFDAQIKRLVSSGLGRNRWFTKRSGMIIFGSNVSALLSRQSNLYRSAQTSMKELSRLGITKLDAERVELLSTVCHSIKETGSTGLEAIRNFMSQWQTDGNRTKAEKFTSEQTQKCIDFIVKNNLQQKLLPT